MARTTNLSIGGIQPKTECEARCGPNDEGEWQATPTTLAPVQFSLLINQVYHSTHGQWTDRDQDNIQHEPKVKLQNNPGLSKD